MSRRKDKVFIMLIVSIGLSIVCSFVAYLSTREKAETQELVIDTYQAINACERLFSLVKDMETGTHGYNITSDSIFLEPFFEAIERIPEETEKLRMAVASNDQQLRFLDKRILPAVENRKNASILSLRIHNAFGRDSASHWVAMPIGKAHMDTVRLLVSTFVHNEQATLAEREATLDRNSRIEEIVQFSSFGLIALTCTLAFLRLSKELRKISHLVDRLELANETLEEKVQMRTQQLSEANASKDHFLGVASHDLKTPLAGMQGLVRLMKLEKKDRSENDLDYLNYLEDACQAMLNMIANLLDINRIDRKEVLFRKEPVAVKKLLGQIEQEFSAHAIKKGIPLHVSSDDVVIQTDPANLVRILENLVSNALKFSSRGQEVSLKASVADSHITFDVLDHGPGIVPEEIPSLFTKFARLSNKPTGGEGSSGLGLAIVKDLTEVAGGTLSVESKRGQGSVFSVRLPVN
ncbi:ATP-binding protein [Chryseolinea sp. T2]|uniref:sensor histidine kinase n=1 Tax=Chryseolinea sp. T2 TaxID=3129255 RepID=UPI003077262F